MLFDVEKKGLLIHIRASLAAGFQPRMRAPLRSHPPVRIQSSEDFMNK